MKFSSVLATLLVVGLIAPGLVGCGGGDSSDPLVGMWTITSLSGTAGGTVITLTASDGQVTGTMTFSDNGTMSGSFSISFMGETDTQILSGTWSASGNQLTVVEDGESQTITFSISGNTLSLSFPEDDGTITMSLTK